MALMFLPWTPNRSFTLEKLFGLGWLCVCNFLCCKNYRTMVVWKKTMCFVTFVETLKKPSRYHHSNNIWMWMLPSALNFTGCQARDAGTWTWMVTSPSSPCTPGTCEKSGLASPVLIHCSNDVHWRSQCFTQSPREAGVVPSHYLSIEMLAANKSDHLDRTHWATRRMGSHKPQTPALEGWIRSSMALQLCHPDDAAMFTPAACAFVGGYPTGIWRQIYRLNVLGW